MTWRMAKSLEVLREQLNVLFPNRSKASDGGIGNAEHSARLSDHNPNSAGVVCARDFTHDPAGGLNSQRLADVLLASRDARIKYVISNRRIAASYATDGHPAWAWRPYTGKNPHDHHVHISVKSEQADVTTPWRLDGLANGPVPSPESLPIAPPTLRKGDKGVAVQTLQGRLNAHGESLKVSGDFDEPTDAAVRRFQDKHGLVDDGVVGPQTWAALAKA